MKEFFRRKLFSFLDRWFAWHSNPRECYDKRIKRIWARDTLIWLLPEQVRAQWAAQKLFIFRQHYWDMQDSYKHFCEFVPADALRHAIVKTWDFKLIPGAIILLFCNNLDDVREIADSVAEEDQCHLVERVFEEAINIGQIKYDIGDENAIRADAAVLLLALEMANSREAILRLRAGMAGWIRWEKAPRTLKRMRDDFFTACEEKASDIGFVLSPNENVPFPYKWIPVGRI